MTQKDIKQLAAAMYSLMKDDILAATKQAATEAVMQQEGFISVPEAAQYLHISEWEVRRHINDLPHYQKCRNGRILFLKSELFGYIRK